MRYALRGRLKGFCGTAIACEEDLMDRGLGPEDLERGVRVLSRVEIDRLLASEEQG